MTDAPEVRVTLPADVHEIDDSGYVWTFLGRANAPERVCPGAITLPS